jgi:hypothetical protein
MLFEDGFVALVSLGLWIFCLVEVISTDETLMRNLGKTWWIVIVLFFPVIGSILWLVAGRPQRGQGSPLPYKGNYGTGFAGRPGRAMAVRNQPSAPDDDPEFLAGIRREAAEDKHLLARWEEDLRRREQQLRQEPGSAAPDPDREDPLT